MNCFGPNSNPAQRRYLQRLYLVLGAYVVLLFSATAVAQRLHPHGVLLGIFALLPSLPVFGLLFVVGRYLAEEQDEYERDRVIRCILWGTAALLGSDMFANFLHTFGWHGSVPPFTNFIIFCIGMVIAKFTYKYRDRVAADD